VDDVTHVVDSGFVKEVRYDPASGVSSLQRCSSPGCPPASAQVSAACRATCLTVTTDTDVFGKLLAVVAR
jgi:hypothetical protein